MISSSQGVDSWTVTAYLPSLALKSGFLKLLQSALRVKEDGLGAFGIPCHSYIFLNCPTHKRNSAQPFGDESLEYIVLANQRLVGDSCFQQCWFRCLWFSFSGFGPLNHSSLESVDLGLIQGLDAEQHSYCWCWFAGHVIYLWNSPPPLASSWCPTTNLSKRCANALAFDFSIHSCRGLRSTPENQIIHAQVFPACFTMIYLFAHVTELDVRIWTSKCKTFTRVGQCVGASYLCSLRGGHLTLHQ